MPAKQSITTPQEYHQIFETAFNAADLEGLVATYEPNAKVSPAPDKQVQGHAAIRAALQQFLALKGTMSLKTVYATETGDLALTRGRWTLNGTDPKTGGPVKMEASSVEVLRRQPGGGWLVAIDHPFFGE